MVPHFGVVGLNPENRLPTRKANTVGMLRQINRGAGHSRYGGASPTASISDEEDS